MLTIRSVPLFVAGSVLIMSFSAHAGTTSVTDGQGTWLSTKCVAPQVPPALSSDPEAAANDLNEKMAVYNDYVGKAQEYMMCISREAQADAEANNQVVVMAAQNVIQQTKEQVSKARPDQKR